MNTDYEYVIQPRRFGYYIRIHHGVCRIESSPAGIGWAAWTFNGAHRKAKRIIARCKREDIRRAGTKRFAAQARRSAR